MTNPSPYQRYQRQLILKGFGEIAQQKLQQSHVLVIGAGGLGCPVLQYLAAAGVGQLTLVDDDQVSLSNLHRQVLYGMTDIGKQKATVAKEKLQEMNPQIAVVAIVERLRNDNAIVLVGNADIVVDCTDNFATRYLINDACVLQKKTLVFGAVSQYEGQVAVFNLLQRDEKWSINYRDLFPVPPKNDEVLNCAEGGVLGVLPGIIGNMQAAEVIKIITGIGVPLANKLLSYNVLNNQMMQLTITHHSQSTAAIPANVDAFLNTNYDWLCGVVTNKYEINSDEFWKLTSSPSALIVDVRETDELPRLNQLKYLSIPLADLKNRWHELNSDELIFICQSGKRSTDAALQASDFFGNQKKYYSLKGGILKLEVK